MNRIRTLVSHLAESPSSCDTSNVLTRQDTAADNEDEYLLDGDGGRNPETHWDGWGYADTRFVLDHEEQVLTLSGGRFAETVGPASNRLTLNDFVRFAQDELGVDTELLRRPMPSAPTAASLPKPLRAMPERFVEYLSGQGVDVTDHAVVRLRRSHGHTCQEVFSLRQTPDLVGRPECVWLKRLVDGVAFPTNEEQVRAIIRAAHDNNVCLVPHGGGTSVTRALAIKENENRSVVCVDMRRMRRITWIDRDNHLAEVQAGVTGKELERRLNRLGLTAGHEPDSIDFSTVGGWIATKASGMKRAKYGNIEDVVISVNLETCMGTLGPKGNSANFERQSAGPDLSKALALGSEGTMGVVTSCVIKLRPVPTHRKYGSVLFRNFDSGIGALRELAWKNLLPASARLMDNAQFKLGQALKPIPKNASRNTWKETAKSFYIETWNGFDTNQVAAATFVYEGFSDAEIAHQERMVLTECKKFGGARGDAENGKRGYFLTFMIAYLRDFGLALNFLSESFEATVPWSKVSTLTKAVERTILQVAKEGGISETPLCGVRISQSYDTCCCCYFYFGIVADNPLEKMHVFSKIEHEARNTIIEQGGSISHHHGVGKAKQEWFPQTQTEASLNLLQKTIKPAVDPKNVFGAGNLGM